MDEDLEPTSLGVKSPIKRLGSTRKLLYYNNIRAQLNEQLRCLDARMETQVAIVAELQDFFRRRAEVELDYSKNMDKLSKTLHARHKEQKQKREQWPMFSSFTCMQQLVAQTKTLSKDHAALSEVYSTHLVARLQQVVDDVQRIYRRCKEIGSEMQEEIMRTLRELHATMKTHHTYQAECRVAESKLRLADNQRAKIEQAIPKEKLQRSKKYRLIQKEVQKRKNKYFDAKLKALKSRNEYVLCLEAANATVHKYFVEDVSDLMDCMDFGFHHCISRCLMMHVTSEKGRIASLQAANEALSICVSSMDSRHDKQRFLEYNHSAFMIPKKFEYQGQKDDASEPALQKLLCADMETRLNQLKNRLTGLRTESEEVWKTLETAEISLLDMLTAKDYDCAQYFGENGLPASKPPETVNIKKRADRYETEEFYLMKLREYLLGTSRIARLDAKREHLRQTLLEASSSNGTAAIHPTPEQQYVIRELCQLQAAAANHSLSAVAKPPRRKRIGRSCPNGQPKLFGGSLEEYLEETNQEIPLVVKSCIRVINLYGLHHQGIFRVSGSQVEINNFRDAFERGEDPLADVTDSSDINSVAGVLKLYLRELREPLFPIIYFDQFMELAQLESKQEFVSRIRLLVKTFPRSVIIFLRYIFAFLNHLSEYSDENMMDPYNVAICFGPTLVPVPEDKDQVQYQNQVNELIKNIIVFADDIYPSPREIGGIVYEKYITTEPDDNDVGDSPLEQTQDDMDLEVYPSEEEAEWLEATAQFDFNARSERELSFKKGDNLILYCQVSNDWWKGSANGSEGLIPDKYIMLKIRDDEKEKSDSTYKGGNGVEEGMRRRASSSNDSMLSSSLTTVTTSSSSSSAGCAPLSFPNWPPLSVDADLEPNEASLNGTIEPASLSKEANVDDISNDVEQLLRVEVEENIRISLVDASPTYRSQSLSRCGNYYLKSADKKFQTVANTRSPILNQKHSKSQTFENSFKGFSLQTVPLAGFPKDRKNLDTRAMCASAENVSTVRCEQTPDLVMDLPVEKFNVAAKTSELDSGSSSGSEPESPDMTLAAERFAKPDQSTLKKNAKFNADGSRNEDTVGSSPSLILRKSHSAQKPDIKAKPKGLQKSCVISAEKL